MFYLFVKTVVVGIISNFVSMFAIPVGNVNVFSIHNKIRMFYKCIRNYVWVLNVTLRESF